MNWQQWKTINMLSWHLIKPVYVILLSVGAIIGVACLIIILSLFRNYYLSSENVFMGIHPHIKIQKENMTMAEGRQIIERLKQVVPEIVMIQPALYANAQAIIAEVDSNKKLCIWENGQLTWLSPKQRTSENTEIVTRYGFKVLRKKRVDFLVKGITIVQNEPATEFKRLINGSIDLNRLQQNTENGKPLPLAFYMEQDIFDTVPPTDFLLAFSKTGKPFEFFRLVGLINLGTRKEEHPLLVMSLENAQRSLGLTDQINVIEIKLKHPYQSARIAENVQALLDSTYAVTSWVQAEQAAFAFLTVIKWMGVAVISSIIVVAAISVFCTLYLTVMENRKKMAILKSLGMTNKNIYSIFMTTTLIIAIIGIFLGSVLGYVGSYASVAYFSDELKSLGIADPQIQITVNDLLVICLVTFAFFLPTSFIPARNAVKIDVVEGLQQ